MCKEPARLVSGAVFAGQAFGTAVHLSTQTAEGPDGHLIKPTDEDPVLRAQADQIEAEAGGKVEISVRWRYFSTRIKTVPPFSATYAPIDADDAQEMRAKLRARGLLPPEAAP